MKIVEGYEEHGVDEAREGSFTYELGTAAWKLCAMPKIALAPCSGLAIIQQAHLLAVLSQAFLLPTTSFNNDNTDVLIAREALWCL